MSRSLKQLRPEFREKVEDLIFMADANDLDLLVYCTYRSPEEQARLYRRGRSLDQIKRKADELADKWGRPDLAEVLMNVGPQKGRIVTRAGPGQSMHQYKLAIDAVPIVDGKAVWGTKGEDLALWEDYGHFARVNGLEWAGDWKSFREFPHVQMPGYDWRELIRAK